MKNIYYLLLPFLFLAACKKAPEEIVEKPKFDDRITVKTTFVEQLNNVQTINAIAIVSSESEAKPAFKTGGVIQKTFVKEGDFVKKGQLLARLHMQEIDATVGQAQQGVIKAERDLARVQNLYADSVATLEQMQNAGTAVEFAKKNLEIATFNRQYSEVRSPISGKVVKQILHDGEITGPGTPVYAIIGVGQADWKIMAGLIDKEWAKVKIGDKAVVTLDAYPGKQYMAEVTDKSVIGGDPSGRIDVELKFKEQPAGLAAGLIGKVSIEPSVSTNGNFLPIEALTRSNGRKAIVFKNDNGKASAMPVTIGDIKNGLIEIHSGLNAGDEIITTGAMYLEDGDSIIVKN